MENIKMTVLDGTDWVVVADNARDIADRAGENVEFMFNSILCVVSSATDLDWLNRDYQIALQLKRKSVGPDCKITIDKETKALLDKEEARIALTEWLKNNAHKIKEERDKLLMGLKEAKDIILTSGIYKETSIGLLGINNLIKEMDTEK